MSTKLNDFKGARNMELIILIISTVMLQYYGVKFFCKDLYNNVDIESKKFQYKIKDINIGKKFEIEKCTQNPSKEYNSKGYK
uniref:Uncharacterized protein n=1 Tax=Strongyloides papillosus TaxID=174720 RepID=A0A0N5BWF6_STREA